MHDLGLFDEYGRIQFSRNHTYTLPPYLKDKLGYKTDPRFYSKVEEEWANLHGISDMEKARENRNTVVERSLIASQVARGGLKIDLKKAEIQEGIDRQNRFIGFQDYDILDSILLAK